MKDELAKKDLCFLSETAPFHHPLLDAALKKAYKRGKETTERKIDRGKDRLKWEYMPTHS